MDKELRKKYELSPEKLRYTANPKEFKPTDKIEPGLEAIIIGQERAVESIQTGLKLEDKYSNIFVTGSQGLGKDEIIRTVLTRYIDNMSSEEYTRKIKQRRDLLAAYNFKQPENPLILELPQGWGEKFEKDLDQAVNYVLKDGIKMYEKQFEMDFMTDNKQLGNLSKKLKEQQAKLQKEGQKIQVEIDRLDKLGQEAQPGSKEAEEYNKKIEKLSQEYSEMDKDSFEKELKIQEEMESLQSQNVTDQKDASKNYKDTFVKPTMEKLKQKYPTQKIKAYLEQFEEAMTHDAETEIRVAQTSVGAKMSGNMMMQMQMPPPPDMSPYQVKILNEIKPEERIKGIPVIKIEEEPSFDELFGYVKLPTLSPTGMEIAKKDQHLRLEAGYLIKANGGYLITNAMETLQEYSLIRLVKDLTREKTNIKNTVFQHSIKTKSQNIPLKIKALLIGDNSLYQILQNANKRDIIKFEKTFGIKAELDSIADNTTKNRELYSKYIARVCNKKRFKPVTPEGIAKIIEYSARLADKQEKLTLKLSDISSVIKEANMRAGNNKYTTAEHVEKAIKAKSDRHSLVKSKVQEFITDGTQIIDTEKDIVGDVNALVVYTLEDLRFGDPTKLTATTSVGNKGIISLDMEAGNSGETFKKAIFTLIKNLERLFAQDKIISLNGGISFEQCYGGIDGDSATLASFLALASQLSEYPVDQEIAVTGSMNQKGVVQPIGGVNEKVEGFYNICKTKGLTGSQGVIIPKLNEKELMLSEEMVDSVKSGKFHVYSVSELEEAIEIIMGNKACEYDANGKRLFSEGTVYNKVNKKIIEYNNALKINSDKE